MTQISLHVEDIIAEKLNAAARLRNCSVSKYVTSVIAELFSGDNTEELRKKELLRQLRGVIEDTTVVEPQEIPMALEIKREYNLI